MEPTCDTYTVTADLCRSALTLKQHKPERSIHLLCPAFLPAASLHTTQSLVKPEQTPASEEAILGTDVASVTLTKSSVNFLWTVLEATERIICPANLSLICDLVRFVARSSALRNVSAYCFFFLNLKTSNLLVICVSQNHRVAVPRGCDHSVEADKPEPAEVLNH